MAFREGWLLLASGRATCHPALQMSTLPTSLQRPNLLGDLLEAKARTSGDRLPHAGELRRLPAGSSVARSLSPDHRQPRRQAGPPLPADPRGAEAQRTDARAP